MARTINRLTHRQVVTLREPGLHADGAGLYLRIDQAGGRRWVLVFHLDGKRREMGFGSASEVTLAKARAAAAEARELVRAGVDPIAERRALAEPTRTFQRAMDDLLADIGPGWRNTKHRTQWKTSVERHAPRLLALAAADVDTETVLKALRPIWMTKPETAKKVRERIERVLDAAKVRGWRTGENPARWRGHLAMILPKRPKLARGHHAALPFADMPAFMARLRAREALAARALEFTILTAARTGEVRGAVWGEIADGVWTVPGARMKAGREHRVPLSRAALAAAGERRGEGDPVFPGTKLDWPMSNGAMERVLDRMEVAVTVHGFRSTFRDWAGDRTTFAREVVEAALAHAVGDATELAYRRSDALEKRRRLMEAWAGYCGQESAKVVPMEAAAARVAPPG